MIRYLQPPEKRQIDTLYLSLSCPYGIKCLALAESTGFDLNLKIISSAELAQIQKKVRVDLTIPFVTFKNGDYLSGSNNICDILVNDVKESDELFYKDVKEIESLYATFNKSVFRYFHDNNLQLEIDNLLNVISNIKEKTSCHIFDKRNDNSNILNFNDCSLIGSFYRINSMGLLGNNLLDHIDLSYYGRWLVSRKLSISPTLINFGSFFNIYINK